MTAELVPASQGQITSLSARRQEEMQTDAVARLGEWAQSALAAHEVAEGLVQTSFVPEAFRGKPHEATAAILAGSEVGLSPLAALRSFDIIQGTAAARAITLRAIVQSQGHEIVLVESTATRCKMKGRRRGTDTWQEVTWTMDRAKNLGLTSKHNWKAQPQAMLVARATSEVCRLVASDAILGIGMSVEEISDGADPSQPVQIEGGEEQPKTRRMSRKRPSGDEKGGHEKVTRTESLPANDAETEGITDAQSRMLHASFNDLGYTDEDRDKRMAYTVEIIGREVTTSSELTKDEASRVIDRLQKDLEQPFPEGEVS
jgi:hypothetical protein